MSSNFDLNEARNNLVAKDNRLIQNSRFSLGAIENKAILYLISKIQPGDQPGKIYNFNCKEFQALLKWDNNASYNYMKIMLQNLGDISWWIDGEIDGRKKDILLRWFNITRMDPGNGDIEISFQSDMFPFLLDLQKHLEEEGRYYTTYKLQNVTLMKHRYSPRIYELLKSYQYNNKKWTFENGTGSEYDLQRRIADTIKDKKTRNAVSVVPESWVNWAIFKRDVLEPAVKEINKYTDIKVAYAGKKEDIHHKKTRAIRTIEFYMVGKTGPEQRTTDKVIDDEYKEIEINEKFHQVELNEMYDMSVEDKFFSDHEASLEEERRENEMFEAEEKEKKADESKHPILFRELNIASERNANMSEKKIEQLYSMAVQGRVAGTIDVNNWELFAVDLITYYYDMIAATPEETKSTTYERLLDCLKNDYDDKASEFIKMYRKR